MWQMRKKLKQISFIHIYLPLKLFISRDGVRVEIRDR
mgnify:CR=1 FL=1